MTTADHIACFDCGLRYYSDRWIETSVPNDVWARISPTGDEGGILCIACIVNRLKSAGLVAPDARDAEIGRLKGAMWRTADGALVHRDMPVYMNINPDVNEVECDGLECRCANLTNRRVDEVFASKDAALAVLAEKIRRA